MKYLILILLFLSGCVSALPPNIPLCKNGPANVKFHYKEKVNVVGGFYKGCNGIVEKYQKDTSTPFLIDLVCNKKWVDIIWFSENNLEAVK